ncbi:putative G-protein coupled receptor 139 [Rhinoraja longicauda]
MVNSGQGPTEGKDNIGPGTVDFSSSNRRNFDCHDPVASIAPTRELRPAQSPELRSPRCGKVVRRLRELRSPDCGSFACPVRGRKGGKKVDLGNCGLSTCTTRYLVAMAAADLLVAITEVILSRIKSHYFYWSFLSITPVCSVNIVLRFAATDCSVWFTVTFTFDRFVDICCQKLKTKYCTGKTAAVVLAIAGVLLCLKNVPRYFTYEPGATIDNVPWGCVPVDSVFTDPGWVTFDWFDTALTPLLPFAVILLLNALTVRHILVASRVRQGLRGQSKGEKRSGPEMENRRRSMVLLFTISGSFILLWLTNVVEFIYYQMTVMGTDMNDSQIIFHLVGYLLSNLSCCTNTFIYAATQSKFREQVKSAVKYPLTSALRLINKPAP